MKKILSNLFIFTLLALLACPQLSAYSEDDDNQDYNDTDENTYNEDVEE